MAQLADWQQRFRARLIVSCQAPEGDPLRDSFIMAALARAAVLGGAGGIRANGPEDVQAIQAVVDCPIVGLQKHVFDGTQCITPTFADAQRLVRAGATLVAVEVTRQRAQLAADGRVEEVGTLIERMHRDLPAVVMADVSTLAEGLEAAKLGCDVVASTLSGYTRDSRATTGPDLDLVRALIAALDVPVIAEGRFTTPEQVREAMAIGAFAVVVGHAITSPRSLTERFVAALP
jgi:N-acylglucosamine-6-phosphate 2-epimerase